VRRQFITTLLARKTRPKGAASFVADCLARDSYMLTQHNRDEVAAELLGIDAAKVHAAVSDLPASSDNRALVIALGLVLGALEARTGKDAWPNAAPVREPGDDRIYYGHSVTSGDYLRFLAAKATPWPPWRKSSPAPAPPPTPTTPTCATRRIQPPTSNSPVGSGAGSTRAGPTARPGSRAHIQRSRRRRRPTCRSAYGAAAQFAFLVLPVWPAARGTQGHGLHWQLHLVAHAITGERDPHRVGVRRRARPADGAAHEQRPSFISQALHQFYNGKVGPPTVNPAGGTTGTPNRSITGYARSA
jgi:hypothetical protein